MIWHPAPAGTTWHAKITPLGELGEPLVVNGQVFAPGGKAPAAGVTVYAYNTDAQGYYGENRKEYPPRLYGWMKTDDVGRFELLTIKPGRYPGMQVPAHIHFTLWGGGYPPRWVDELRFEGDSYLTPAMVAEDRARESSGRSSTLTGIRRECCTVPSIFGFSVRAILERGSHRLGASASALGVHYV
jgi:protocatechuate 3,4-dioxygenase beta subunit